MIVLDASCLVELVLQSQDAGRIEARIASVTGRIHAPQLIDVEVLHALRRLVVAGEIDSDRADRAVALLIAFPLRRASHRRLRARIWGLRQNVSAHDATYVALAERLGCVVLTRDARLARAPGLAGRVELI